MFGSCCHRHRTLAISLLERTTDRGLYFWFQIFSLSFSSSTPVQNTSRCIEMTSQKPDRSYGHNTINIKLNHSGHSNNYLFNELIIPRFVRSFPALRFDVTKMSLTSWIKHQDDQFCVLYTDLIISIYIFFNLDCNRFCHQLSLSLWS